MPGMAQALGVALSLVVAGPLAAVPEGLESPEVTPIAVTIAGSLQFEVGCAGDWDPTCALTHLTYDPSDLVWQGTFSLPSGAFEYLAAIDDSWAESYGLHGEPNGPNIPLALPGAQAVKFYYDDATHWVTDDIGSVIATAPGSFQSELGCVGDWAPDCLRSWLQDLDGDGIYRITVRGLLAGSYEFKVAIDEAWTENYGLGGVPNGANVPFSVTPGYQIDLFYDATTHVPTWTTALFADDFELRTLAAWSAIQP
jgi:hypothetical protein